MVICSEPPNNPGTSITNSAERIAAEVIYVHRLPVPLVWIEHYEYGARGTPEDPASFDMVLFSSYEVEDLGHFIGERSASKRIGSPSWKALDRASVEALVGAPV